MNDFAKKIKAFSPNLFFVTIVLIIAIYYNYHEYLFARPQSIHAWRQADCASLTLNYHQKGMNFFNPEVHNLNSDSGTTGYCATSEAPVLYFFVATLYKVFGTHESILRAINTFIFLLGLFYIYKLIYYLFKDYFWAFVVSILFFTSPVLVYYGNNYLTNVSALSLAIIGWFYLFRYIREKTKLLLIMALFFFLIAGLFKITALMSLFAIGGYFLYERIKYLRKKQPIIFHNSKLFIIGSVSILFIILGWVLYADYYNTCHDCYYFSTTIFPIWSLKCSQIIDIVKHIKDYWLQDYFHLSVYFLFLILFSYIIYNIKRVKSFYLVILLLLLLQSVIYILLQFWTFHDHDYYTINQFITPFFIVIVSFDVLSRHNIKLKNSRIIKVTFSLLIIFNIYHAKIKVSERFTGLKNRYYKEHKDIYTITPYLREIGISKDDKVIYIPDGSNVSLYLMNQSGWTQYTDARFNRDESIRYNRDSIGINESIERGAKYLIVNSLADIYLHSYLNNYTNNLVGNYGSVLIFNLTDTTKNFEPGNRKIKNIIFCGAENVNEDQFLTNSDSFSLDNGHTQSKIITFEGKFSSKLDSETPFGMTFSTSEISYGESFIVSVWRKGSKKSGIIASGPLNADFYLNKWKVIQVDSISGWEKLELEFFIPSQMDNEELKIYLYNPTNEPSYFDNLEIRWFKRPIFNNFVIKHFVHNRVYSISIYRPGQFLRFSLRQPVYGCFLF